MKPPDTADTPEGVPEFAAWGVVVSLGVFAVFRSRSMPAGILGPAGLLAAAACLVAGVVRTGNRCGHECGLTRPRFPAGAWLAASALLGILLGAAYRVHKGIGPWPSGLGSFVALAAAIGGIEEMLYRGFVQSGLSGHGRFVGVACAAAGHTIYKCLLFAWRPGMDAADLGFLVVATFLVGMGFGALRESSRSIWPPVLAHAGFDIMVYGALHQAPWWVWD